MDRAAMISDRHRAIFVHIPKCAGQSVEMAFLSDNGLDWETRAPLLLRPNPDPERGPPRLAHLTAADYMRCGHITAETFADYYTFAVVRDPWARAVSLYRHLAPNISFRDFAMRWLPEQLAARGEAASFWFVRPQADFVTDAERVIVKDILRFETLQEEFARVVAATGLRSPLPHANRSEARTRPDVLRTPSLARRLRLAAKAAVIPQRFETRARWQDFYGPETAAEIGRLYATDAALFGYHFAMDGARS
jgi:hypothetical protein